MFLSKIKKLANNETLRNGAFFTFFSFVNKGSNFVLLVLLAKFITPIEYGYWSLFGTVVMFIGYFMAMTTEGYISISYFQEGMIGVKKTLGSILFTSTIVSCLLFFILSLSNNILEQILKIPYQYLCLTIGIAFFTIFSNVFLDFFRIKKAVILYGLFSCSNAIVLLGLSVFFVKWLLMGWQGCAWAQFLTVALLGIIGIGYFLFGKKIAFPSKAHWIMMLCWGIPLIPHFATTFIRLGCDRYIIGHFFSIEMVGIFSFAYTLAMAISTIGLGFNQANSITIYEILGNRNTSSEEKNGLLMRQKRIVFVVYLCGFFLITILCAILIPHFFPNYSSAISYFIILSIFAFLQCIYFFYTNFLFFFKCTKKLMYITFSFSILHLILSLCFTSHSVYYTCIIYCFTQIGILFFIRKESVEVLEKEFNCKIKGI